MWAGIGQSVERLSTGWTVWDWVPVEARFSATRPDQVWDRPNLLHNAYRVFPEGKAAGAWRWPPTQSKTEVKERVELYFYSPSRPSLPVLGWTLPLPFTFYFSMFLTWNSYTMRKGCTACDCQTWWHYALCLTAPNMFWLTVKGQKGDPLRLSLGLN